jgi:hypothetical protein
MAIIGEFVNKELAKPFYSDPGKSACQDKPNPMRSEAHTTEIFG